MDPTPLRPALAELARVPHRVNGGDYPFGPYNDHIINLVKGAGFLCVDGSAPGILHTCDKLLSLTGLGQTASLNTLVSALEEYQHRKERKKVLGRGLTGR